MRKALPLLVLALLAAPLAAPADGGIQLSARAGASKPFGKISGGEGGDLADAVDWAFPLQADLQFRLLKQLSVGAYGRYAPTVVASKLDDACTAGNVSCSYAGIGFGGIAEYRFRERLEGGPWVGLSAGYAMLKGDTATAGRKTTSTLSGFDATLQVGTDLELGGLTVGPFLSAGAGQFTKAKSEGEGSSTSSSISDKAVHGWAGVGLRVVLLL